MKKKLISLFRSYAVLPFILLISTFRPLGNEYEKSFAFEKSLESAEFFTTLNSIVERHDYSKIVDLTFPALNTEAGKLVAVLQQKYGSSISNFKIYEFGMYAPSVYAGKKSGI